MTATPGVPTPPSATLRDMSFALTKASLPILGLVLYFIILGLFVALSLIISLSLSLAPFQFSLARFSLARFSRAVFSSVGFFRRRPTEGQRLLARAARLAPGCQPATTGYLVKQVQSSQPLKSRRLSWPSQNNPSQALIFQALQGPESGVSQRRAGWWIFLHTGAWRNIHHLPVALTAAGRRPARSGDCPFCLAHEGGAADAGVRRLARTVSAAYDLTRHG